MTSYAAKIAGALARFGKNGTENPDSKHNQGSLLGEFFMWRMISRFADNQVESLKKKLVSEGFYNVDDLDQGNHILCESPSFTLIAKVSAKVRQFNPDELALLLSKSKYKVPIPIVKDMIDQAKVPGKSKMILDIVER